MSKSEGEKPARSYSLSTGIELILQRMIIEENMRRPDSFDDQVHVVDGPSGDLEIYVGPLAYNSVVEVPPGPVRDILQRAVEEWMNAQEG